MSRQKNNYENTRFGRFERWVNGEIDPLEGRMEIVPPPPSSLTDETVTVDYKKIPTEAFDTVSYTHLDVYKRQALSRLPLPSVSLLTDGAPLTAFF